MDLHRVGPVRRLVHFRPEIGGRGAGVGKVAAEDGLDERAEDDLGAAVG